MEREIFSGADRTVGSNNGRQQIIKDGWSETGSRKIAR